MRTDLCDGHNLPQERVLWVEDPLIHHDLGSISTGRRIDALHRPDIGLFNYAREIRSSQGGTARRADTTHVRLTAPRSKTFSRIGRNTVRQSFSLSRARTRSKDFWKRIVTDADDRLVPVLVQV